MIHTRSYREKQRSKAEEQDHSFMPNADREGRKTEPPDYLAHSVPPLVMVYAELSMRAGAYPEEVVRLTVRFGPRCSRANAVEILCCHRSQMLGVAESYFCRRAVKSIRR
jgi:hypothetical protein